MKISIIGATGLVGDMFLRVLEERNFQSAEIIPFATEKSAGAEVRFNGRSYVVRRLTRKNIEDCELALFSGGADIARSWADTFAQANAVVVDNSSAFRGEDDVPLVVPEVNSGAINGHRGIIANPNCSTIGMVVALYPLHRVFGLKSVVITSFQSVSGAGRKAVYELRQQLAKKTMKSSVFPRVIADNCIPQIGAFLANDETVEEKKFRDEARKIMNLPGLKVCATAVRAPVSVGHSLSISARFEGTVDVREAERALASAPGVKLFKSPDEFPTPLDVAGSDYTFVGRVRKVPGFPRSLNMWVVVDNLRKGAATNAVQIAEIALSNRK